MNSPLLALFAGIASAHFLALLSPGPDFALLVKSGMSHERNKALGVVLGITLSNALYIMLSLSGLVLVISASPPLLNAIKLLGGLYLCRIGSPSLIPGLNPGPKPAQADESGQDTPRAEQTTFFRELARGFTASLLNPKLPLFYLGLFSVLLAKNVRMGLIIGMGIWMTLIVFAWDSLLLCFLSSKPMQRVLRKHTRAIGRICGIILFLLGLSLLVSFVFGI